MTRILMMGPPGVGKGTQAARLASHLKVPWISTGDLFREQVRSETALGLQIRDLMGSGHYLPDEIADELVSHRLAELDAQDGFILDGYPRTAAQVQALDLVLAASSVRLTAIVVLDAVRSDIIARLLQRAGEQGRADDTPEVIDRRLQVYADEAAELFGCYADRGVLLHVDGMGHPDAVAERIWEALQLPKG
ncbi:adenylate kinase [Arthrobacter sp. SA17]